MICKTSSSMLFWTPIRLYGVGPSALECNYILRSHWSPHFIERCTLESCRFVAFLVPPGSWRFVSRFGSWYRYTCRWYDCFRYLENRVIRFIHTDFRQRILADRRECIPVCRSKTAAWNERCSPCEGMANSYIDDKMITIEKIFSHHRFRVGS